MRAVNADVRSRERTGAPRRAPFVLLVVGLIGAGLCALLAINTAAAADEVRQRNLTSSNADASNQMQQLKIDIANKQAPAALASAARKLGMVPNPNPAFLVVAPNGTVALAGSPAKVAGNPIPTPTVTPTVTPTSSAPASSAPASTTPSPGAPVAAPTATTVAITGAR